MPVETIPLPDGRVVKLGRIRPKAPRHVLRLSTYLTAPTTPPPSAVDYTPKAAVALGRMYLNDQYGDCVIAGKYHAVGVWTGNDQGSAVQGTDQEVLASYHTICGPGDNGCDIVAVLDYWKAKGMPFGGVGHKLGAYVAVDTTNKLEMQTAIFLFGALSIGINLPAAWADNAHPGFVWDVTTSSIVGGHDVTIVGYDSNGVQISTWGMVGTITWRAMGFTQWVEEGYALLSADWYGNDNLAPCGVDKDTLAADLAKLGGGVIPDPSPVPPVPPSPPVPDPCPTVCQAVRQALHAFNQIRHGKGNTMAVLNLTFEQRSAIDAFIAAGKNPNIPWQQILQMILAACPAPSPAAAPASGCAQLLAMLPAILQAVQVVSQLCPPAKP